MAIISGTPGDDIILIDNNVITVNGVLFTDPLEGISLNTGNNVVTIINSTIDLDFLIATSQPSDGESTIFNIIDSEVTVNSGGSVPDGIIINGVELNVTNSDLTISYFKAGTLGNTINFTDSNVTSQRAFEFTSSGVDTVTITGSTVLGEIDADGGADTITIVDSSVAQIRLGASHDSLTFINSTATRLRGNGGTDSLDLPVGTVVNDSGGTFTVEEGVPYTVGSGSFTLPTGQTVTYVQFEGGGPAVVCFCQDTLICTENGDVAVQDLSVGDMIMTDEGEARPLRWIGRRRLNLRELQANDKLYPVRITAGSLGNGLPEKDLLVSRQHRMLVRSGIVQRMFGLEEVLIPAIKLTALPGIFIDASVETVTYFHLLLDEHSVILAEGTPAESLATGPQAMKALSPEAREEIRTLFPAMFEQGYEPEFARPVPEGRKQRALIQRHLKNGQPLLSH